MYTAIIAIIMFLLVVTIHEGGHFLIAKAVGIKVNEFAIGMGPKILEKVKGDTKYTLRLLPIGGYVAMEGEDDNSEDPRSFNNASPIKRLAVVLAGAFMNFVLAIVLFTIIFSTMSFPTTSIGEIIEDSPAYSSGLEIGDEIIKINNQKIKSWDQVPLKISESDSQDIEIEVNRDGVNHNIKVETVEKDGRKIVGIIPGFNRSFLGGIKEAFNKFVLIIKLMFQFFGNLFTGNFNAADLSGPVGVIAELNNAVSKGIYDILFFIGLISVNLGFINLLPIPALDGGRAIFILLEMLRGKPIPVEKEGMVHLVGFILLIGLMIFITILDFKKFF